MPWIELFLVPLFLLLAPFLLTDYLFPFDLLPLHVLPVKRSLSALALRNARHRAMVVMLVTQQHRCHLHAIMMP
ncbi:hypothetical protein V8C34DRAFT_293152 [Trichoderma compactum]